MECGQSACLSNKLVSESRNSLSQGDDYLLVSMVCCYVQGSKEHSILDIDIRSML